MRIIYEQDEFRRYEIASRFIERRRFFSESVGGLVSFTEATASKEAAILWLRRVK